MWGAVAMATKKLIGRQLSLEYKIDRVSLVPICCWVQTCFCVIFFFFSHEPCCMLTTTASYQHTQSSRTPPWWTSATHTYAKHDFGTMESLERRRPFSCTAVLKPSSSIGQATAPPRPLHHWSLVELVSLTDVATASFHKQRTTYCRTLSALCCAF